MKSLLQKSRIQHLVQNRNGYLTLAVGSMILNILLVFVIFCMIGSERIILIPPTISKTFWVERSQVSPEYLSEMSLFLSGIRFNMTPSNALIQREIFLRYVDPSHYENLKSSLLDEEEHLKKEHISVAFYTNDVRVDSIKLVAKITGDLQYTIGDTLLPMQHAIYQLKFTYNNGRLLLKTFEEVKANA